MVNTESISQQRWQVEGALTLLERASLSVLLKFPLANAPVLASKAKDSFRDLYAFLSLTTEELQWNAWRALSRRQTKPIFQNTVTKFVTQIVIQTRLLMPMIAPPQLYFIAASVYKDITRHFFHLEYLPPDQLLATLRKHLSFRSNARWQHPCNQLIQQVTHNLLYPKDNSENAEEIATSYKKHCRCWKDLPPFSELEHKEWEELVWQCDMLANTKKDPLKQMRGARPYLEALLTELNILHPEAEHHEIASFAKEVQQRLQPLLFCPTNDFVDHVISRQTELLQDEKEGGNLCDLTQTLQHYIKEILRFSQNLDTTINYVTFAYRETQRLPKISLSEYKKMISNCRNGFCETSGKLAIYDPIKTFICKGLRELYENHPNISDYALTKELIKAYDIALSLPPLHPEELEKTIVSNLFCYQTSHPLHNTLRPITLGYSFTPLS